MKKLKYIVLLLTVLIPGISSAQEAASQGFVETYKVEIVLGLAVIVCLVALMAMYVMLMAMKTMLRAKMAEEGLAEPELIKAREGEEHLGFWGRLWNRLNEAVPVAKEHTVATDHEYDGIKELDNRLPPWWLWGFYFTIFFGVVYLINFHVIGTGMSSDEEFQTEMARADEEVKTYLASLDNLIDETNVELLTSSSDLAAGRDIYEANCTVCHMSDGGGGVGPNFTDKYWIHGGSIKDIFYTVKVGVPAKGMISWESQLSPKKMQQVSSYIYQFEGTTPADPKEPQGELYERASLEESDSAEETGEGEEMEEAASDTTAVASL